MTYIIYKKLKLLKKAYLALIIVRIYIKNQFTNLLMKNSCYYNNNNCNKLNKNKNNNYSKMEMIKIKIIQMLKNKFKKSKIKNY